MREILGFNGAVTLRSRKLWPSPRIRKGESPLQWGRDLAVTETTYGALTLLLLACFNGAVTLRSRKRYSGSDRNREYIGFNGAVTLRSRKPLDPAHLPGSAADPLQWGRDLAVTETFPASATATAYRTLQWGRDLAVTETKCVSHTGNSVSGFNGAVTLRSRKPRPYWRRDADQVRFNGAVTLRSRKLVARLRPHLGRMGFNGAVTLRSRKRDGSRTGDDAYAWLQWGRDLAVTETGPVLVTFQPRIVLQWGRDLAVTETLRALPAEQTDQASMGP